MDEKIKRGIIVDKVILMKNVSGKVRNKVDIMIIGIAWSILIAAFLAIIWFVCTRKEWDKKEVIHFYILYIIEILAMGTIIVASEIP